MRIRLNPRRLIIALTIVVACCVAAIVIIVGTVTVVTLIKICRNIPPPQPPQTDAGKFYHVYAGCLPMATPPPEQQRLYFPVLYTNAVETNLALTLYSSTNSLQWEPVAYLTGYVNEAEHTFNYMQYDTNGLPVLTNSVPMTNSP